MGLLAAGALALALAAPHVQAQTQGLQERATPPTTLSTPTGEVVVGEMTGIEAAEVGVLKYWFERIYWLEVGSIGGAEAAVSEIRALMDREGIRGMEVLAGAFAHEGYTHLVSGNYLRARESLALALRFDPTLPSAHFGLAKARRLSGEGVVVYLQEMAAGFRAALGNFWYSYVRLGNALFLLLASMMTFGVIFSLVATVRHQAKWRHDVIEFLQARGFSEGRARLGGILVLFAPLFLWLGGVWLLLYWTVGVFRYMGRSERVVALLLVAFLATTIPALSFVLSVFHVTDSPTVKATVSALKGGYEPEKVTYIQQILAKRPDDPTFHFLLASVLKDGGYFVEAFKHYKLVIDLEPDNHRAYNNIGNIYFDTSQYGQAVNWYRRATELSPQYAIGFFNANLAQKEQLHFTEADVSLDLARAIDADAVAGFLERAGEVAAGTPVDDKIPMSEAWFEVIRNSPRRGTAASPWAVWLNPVTGAAAVALVLMIASGLVLGRRVGAESCSRCGRAFCARCGELGRVKLCPQCMQLMLRKDEIAPELRARKLGQVVRWERWSRRLPRLVSSVLPGGGQLLCGRAAWGGLLILAWSALWFHRLLGPRLLAFSASPYAAPTTFASAAIAALVVVWLLGNLIGLDRPVAAGD